jgi:hypothetical protein
MAARNYQPTLRRLLHTINRFIARYQALIRAGMTSDEAAALTVFSVALEDLINQLGTGGGE